MWASRNSFHLFVIALVFRWLQYVFALETWWAIQNTAQLAQYPSPNLYLILWSLLLYTCLIQVTGRFWVHYIDSYTAFTLFSWNRSRFTVLNSAAWSGRVFRGHRMKQTEFGFRWIQQGNRVHWHPQFLLSTFPVFPEMTTKNMWIVGQWEGIIFSF